MEKTAEALGVSPEELPSFGELYTRLTEKKGGRAPSQRDLSGWQQHLAAARATCAVDLYVEANKGQLKEAVDALAQAMGAEPAAVEGGAMRRLRFCGVYGLKSGLTLEAALHQVTQELHAAAASPLAAAGLKLEHGIYDRRHRAIRDQAYPYLPSVSASNGDKVIQAVVPETGELLGYIALQGSYVDDLAVLPSLYGKAVGKALVAGAAHYLKKSGHGDVCLDVRASNEPAISLYRRVGFRFSDRGFPGFLDWHGGYECDAATAEVAKCLPSSADVSSL